MMGKEEILEQCTKRDYGYITTDYILAMSMYADQQQRFALEKFKADAIYCNDGIANMDIENYLNPELR